MAIDYSKFRKQNVATKPRIDYSKFLPAKTTTQQKPTFDFDFSTTYNNLRKPTSRPSPLVALEQQGIARSTPMIPTDAPDVVEGALEFGKTVLRAFPKAGISFGVEALAPMLGVEPVYTPQSKVEKIIFGDEPVIGAFTETKEVENKSKEFFEKIGFDSDVSLGMSKAFAPIFVGGIKGLDLLPFGGNRKAVEKLLAKTTDIVETANILKKMGVSDDLIKITAEKMAQTADEKIISKALQNLDDVMKTTKTTTASKIDYTKFTKPKGITDNIAKAKAEGKSVSKSEFIPKAKIIPPEDLGEIRDFNDFVRGAFKPKDTSKLEIGARRLAERLDINPNLTNKQLATKFDKILDEKLEPLLIRDARLKRKEKPKTLTGEEQLAKREATKLEIETARAEKEALKFPNNELEGQYQQFKKLATLKQIDEIEDVAKLKAKIKAKPEAIDNILYSQEKNIDEVFEMFKDRRFKELPTLPKLPKETKAVIAAKARKQIKTGKEILDRRRTTIDAVKRQFGLSDNDLKKITRKDIRLMKDFDFKQFVDDIRAKSVKFAETRQAKNQVLSQVRDKELQRVDNLRKAMKLPRIDNMSIKQLGELEEILSKTQFGDVFLTKRQLETVGKTELGDIKTLREARELLAKKLGVSVDELNNIKVSELDRLRFDTALAERNPFYKMLVEETHSNMLLAEEIYLKQEKEINDLVNKARKSRKRGVMERLVPTDKRVFDYLSGKKELAKKMTSEELELANYLQVRFGEALDYLTKNKILSQGRENYITNIRRGFLEAMKEDGIKQGFKEMFTAYKQDEQVFNILDQATDQILPLEKFFQFSIRRSGDINPTKNIAKASNIYFKTLSKKIALDSLIPKLDIYTQALTPPKLTPKGLEFDVKLKKFVNEWINTKKGRKTKLIAKQGGKIDIGLRAIRSFLYAKDLAFSLPVGIASLAGEQVSTFVNIGNKKYLKGMARMRTKQGKQIVEKYKNFVGKSIWEELGEPSKNIGDKFTESMFGLFAQSTREANKIHLLGSLTKEELKAGKISAKRLAEMKLETGRYRALSEGKSIIGSTAEGGVLTQYKTWAIPIFRTTAKNLSSLSKKIAKGNFKEAITSKELREILREVEVTAAVMFLGNKFLDEEDDSFIGTMTKRLYMEAMTIMGALDTKMMLAAPRLVSFVENLGQIISSIVKLEEYKTKPGYIGVERVKREFTPGAVRQFKSKEKTNTGLPKLPSLPALPSLPKLP